MEIWAPSTIPSAVHFITENNPLASTLKWSNFIMFDDIFLVFNEYAYQFERHLRITREKPGYIIAQNGLYIHVFLKGLKIYHKFCVMSRLCAKSLDNHFDLQKKRRYWCKETSQWCIPFTVGARIPRCKRNIKVKILWAPSAWYKSWKSETPNELLSFSLSDELLRPQSCCSYQ